MFACLWWAMRQQQRRDRTRASGLNSPARGTSTKVGSAESQTASPPVSDSLAIDPSLPIEEIRRQLGLAPAGVRPPPPPISNQPLVAIGSDSRQEVQIDSAPPHCPNCHVLLEKRPQRKTKCKHCHLFIYVKYRPNDRVKRLVSESAAAEIDQEWIAYQQANTQARIDRELAGYGVPPGTPKLEADAQLKKFAESVANCLVDRQMAALMLSMRVNGAAKKRWVTEVYRLKLAQFIEYRVKEVQLSGQQLCPTCASLAGKRFSTMLALTSRPVPNTKCSFWRSEYRCCLYWRAVI